MIEIMQYMCKYDRVFLVDLIRKKRFPVGTHSFIFVFAFTWNMAFMCMPVYKLQSYEYF